MREIECEWEFKNICYTISIKHYYSLPSGIVETFNNCPYCGKKIKIIGDRESANKE